MGVSRSLASGGRSCAYGLAGCRVAVPYRLAVPVAVPSTPYRLTANGQRVNN